MQFNASTNSLYADALFWSGATSTTFPVDPDFTRSANVALDRVVSLILRADNRWEWNDTNLSTELIDVTTNLASGTQKYAISLSWLKIGRVRAKDQNGNWITLRPIQRSQLSDSHLSASGTPYGYFKLGGFLYLVNIPNYASSGGLEVQFQRGADYFVIADTTKTPGVAPQFHRLISLYAALDFTEANELQARSQKIQGRIEALERELLEFYSDRDRDGAPSLSVRGEDYGSAAMDDYGPFNSNPPRGFN